MKKNKIHKISKDMVNVLFHFSNAMRHVFIHDKSLLLAPLHFELYSSQEDEGMQKEVMIETNRTFHGSNLTWW
jgi:hypothetical protein